MLWNRAQRLTGVKTPAAMVLDLFQDSLLFLGRLPQGPLAMVDIGAGAGIPGVPLRIVRPEISLTLIESKRKRVSFLSSLRRELGLFDVSILEGRAEALIRQSDESLQGRFDVVVSRAAGPLFRLLPTAMQYLRSGGLFINSGAPSEKTRPPVPGPFRAEWEVIHFRQLGLSRSFLVVRKQGDT